MRFRHLAPALLLIVALPLRAEERRPLAIDDLFKLDSARGLILSPDGRRAVFVRHWIDATSKQERSSLWLVEKRGDPGKPLEEGQPDGRAPVFSPDGKWLAFLSTRPRPDGWKQTPAAPPQSDPATDVWLLPLSSGAAIPLAEKHKPYGRVFNDGFYGRIVFSADSKRLVFVADDGGAAATDEEKKAGVERVRDDQGEGYTGYGTAQIWVAHLDEKPQTHAAGRVERLTNDDVWYGDPQWAPDCRTLVVHANKTADRESVRYSINKDYDLYAIDAATKKQTRLTTGPGPEVSPRFSPDGKRLACLSIPRKGSHRDVFNLTIVTLGADGPRTRIVFNHHGPDADKAPHPAPSFPLPDDCWDGDSRLVFNAELGLRTETLRVNVASGTVEALDLDATKPGNGSIAGRILLRRDFYPPDNSILRQRQLGTTRTIHWENEGLKLDGLLTTPPESVAKPPYRLIVYPHGGPHSRSAYGFDFTVQTLAAHGYAVFQPNFRGSSGYGQKFIDADRGDFGGGDMRDIFTGIEELVKQKLADPDHLFVYGVSYGGFMTTWLVGHTNRFRAAVSQNAVTDLNMMWALSDLKSWVEWEFGWPWEVPQKLRDHSPLAHADKVRTPTLVLHSRDDRRCPLPMGRAFYEAIKANGVPTEMIVYPDEGHGIRQPRHREDVLRRTLAWFEKHDKK